MTLAAGKQFPARAQGIAAHDRVSDAKPANVSQTLLLQEQRLSLESPFPEGHRQRAVCTDMMHGRPIEKFARLGEDGSKSSTVYPYKGGGSIEEPTAYARGRSGEKV